ncbi:MAG: exopolyphosphatase [Desulfobacterales bacterium]|jgi:oligoribonuclease NrnB/cAMP/cGMP phosphodiesterase (DHH superfamily)
MRIITRPDFDGIVCAVLLYDALEIKKPILWVEPNDVQKGRIDILNQDIIANLPYDERCALWFDHHFTNQIDTPFKGAFQIAPSAAGIIFEYYKERFQRDYSELVQATDKIDSANLTLDEVLHPEKYPYVLISLTVSNEAHPNEPYWNMLVELFRKQDIQQILKNSEVKQHCQEVIQQNDRYVDILKQHTVLNRHIALTDFRSLDRAPFGNRFLVYSLFPEASVNVRIRREKHHKDIVVVNVGHSIFNPGCNVNVGLMLAEFGGGGHRGAGSARVPLSKADEIIAKIVHQLLENKRNEHYQSRWQNSSL